MLPQSKFGRQLSWLHIIRLVPEDARIPEVSFDLAKTYIASVIMKLSIIVLAGALSVVSSAYRIDLYSEYDFQGTQSTFVRKQVLCHA